MANQAVNVILGFNLHFPLPMGFEGETTSNFVMQALERGDTQAFSEKIMYLANRGEVGQQNHARKLPKTKHLKGKEGN